MSTIKNSRLSLDEVNNSSCLQKCNKELRNQITDDGLCQQTYSNSDGLKVRCVGPWAYKKIYSLTQYFSTFSIAMKEHWRSINYIEICSGPGRCINREDGAEFNGTPLSIVDTKGFKVINKAIFFDYNADVVDSLNSRFKSRGVDKAIAMLGDYKSTEIHEDIRNNIPSDGLTLVFLDPTDLSISFDFICELKKYLKNIDLIINVAIGTDFNRNIKNVLLNPSFENSYQKYVSFLGSDDFFNNPKVIKLADIGKQNELRALFREAYQLNLKTLGFEYFDAVQVMHYYDLLYSKSKTGLKLWKNAHAINYLGQRSLF